jgi:phosphohistidine phosphatase
MKLYLVQHGEACSKEENPERPLTVKGEADAKRLAGLLDKAGIRVSRVIHSGKLRAQQTAEILAHVMAQGVELEISGLINPNDNPGAFDWQSGSWEQDILVVGHLPFMARLVSHLVVETDDQIITSFTPGTMVCLELESEKPGQICWMVRPELLA